MWAQWEWLCFGLLAICTGNFNFIEQSHFFLTEKACVISVPKMDFVPIRNWIYGWWHLFDCKFQRLFSFMLSVYACWTHYISMTHSWLRHAGSASLQRWEEARNSGKQDVCQRVGLHHHLALICSFFSWLLQITISLILKPEASIMGLMSTNTQNNRKHNYFAHRSTNSASPHRHAALWRDARRFPMLEL